MKYNYLLLLISLVFMSCGKSNKDYENEYADLSKRFDERCKDYFDQKKVIDSLEKIIMLNIKSDSIPNKIRIKDRLLKDPFFDKYEYANYIKILPKTYFVTVNKNNATKNYVCQFLESMDGSPSKFVFNPTNLNIIDILGKYNTENTTAHILEDLWDE